MRCAKCRSLLKRTGTLTDGYAVLFCSCCELEFATPPKPPTEAHKAHLRQLRFSEALRCLHCDGFLYLLDSLIWAEQMVLRCCRCESELIFTRG
jgi:hypothetical protein